MNYSDVKTTADYVAYCKETAESIVEVAADLLKEAEKPVNAESVDEYIGEHGLVHESIDDDAMMIYYHGHDIILQHTDNENYGTENMGWEGMQADSWQGIKQNVAYWAFYGDVSDALHEAIAEVSEVMA